MRPDRWAVALLAGSLALAGCTDDATGPQPRRYTIEVDGGSGQYGTGGAVLADPLRVRVTDAGTDEPVEGLPVAWHLSDGSGAEILAPTTLTDSTGIAHTDLRLGADTGVYRAIASTNRLFGSTASFEARAVIAPSITSIQPDTVDAGAVVTIAGDHFDGSGTRPAVLFDGIRGEIISAERTEVRARVPACVPTGPVDVAVQLGAVSGSPAPVAVIGDGAEPLRLQVGEARSFERGELDCLRLPGAESGAMFLAVLQNATKGADQPMPFQLAGVAGTAASGTADERAARGVAPSVDAGVEPPALDWEVRLRRREARLSAERVLRRPADELRPRDAAAVTPSVGDEKTFLVYNQDEEFDTVAARVEHVSEHAVIYQDLDAPAGGFTTQDFEGFGALFDDPIYDTTVSAFGSPSDVDGNGHIVILFTPVVNALTDRDAAGEGFIAGFFYGLDLTDGAGSNEAEIFYSLVPDPDGEFSGARSKQDVLRTVPPVLAHEFQHMIHFNQRHIVRDNDSAEKLWLSEALAHMAEDLVADSLLARGDSVNGRSFKGANTVRAYNYLGDPSGTSLVAEDRPGTLELRGAAWLFLKYLMGHHGGVDLLGRLTRTARTGVGSVTAETGLAWETLFHRWSAALWIDDAPELDEGSVDPALTFTNMELRTEIDRWLRRSFPLLPAPQPFQDLLRRGSLPASSADHLIFHASSPDPPPLHLNFAGRRGGALLPAVTPQVGLVRIR